MIKSIAEKMGIDVNPELITVMTMDEAITYRHIGGPTIQINGTDIEPEARDIYQYGLA